MSAALVIHHFGSKEGLRKACDDYIAEEIRTGKSASLQTKDPADWFAQMAEIESYAPLMAYLVRSMQSGSELAKMLWRKMIDDAEQYLEEGVRNGLLEAERDPRARAKYLGIIERRQLSACICKCTTTQPICAPSCATTARRWCCPPSRSTPRG